MSNAAQILKGQLLQFSGIKIKNRLFIMEYVTSFLILIVKFSSLKNDSIHNETQQTVVSNARDIQIRIIKATKEARSPIICVIFTLVGDK